MKQQKKTILLIDDDYKKFIDVLSLAATAFQLNIIGFDTIENGLIEFQSKKDKIGAILLDLSFTKGNYEGVEGVEKIRAINQLVPVVILTGSQSSNDLTMAVNCMKNGAFNYILKTNLDPISLFEMLKVAIRQYESKATFDREFQLKEEYYSKISCYVKMLRTTEMIVSDLLMDQMMFFPSIEKRIKEFNSFYNKLLIKEEMEGLIEHPFKRFTDIAGLRMIFYNSSDLEKAVQILQSSDDFLSNNGALEIIADNKTNSFGYRAYHFDVKINPEKRLNLKEYNGIEDIPCEIQFKTIFAHSWSTVYHALAYKQKNKKSLNERQYQLLKNDFNNAAKKLEVIENQISILCKKHEL